MPDIYSKNVEDDSEYRDDIIDVTDELELYLNQIRNLFSVEEGMVMGASSMSIGQESMLFNTSIPNRQLEEQIASQIATWCTLSNKFRTQVQVKPVQGTERDIIFTEIFIDGIKKLEFRLK